MTTTTTIIIHLVFWVLVTLAVAERIEARHFRWSRLKVITSAMLWPILWPLAGVYLVLTMTVKIAKFLASRPQV